MHNCVELLVQGRVGHVVVCNENSCLITFGHVRPDQQDCWFSILASLREHETSYEKQTYYDYFSQADVLDIVK